MRYLFLHRNKETPGLKAAWEGTSSAFRTSTNQVINHC